MARGDPRRDALSCLVWEIPSNPAVAFAGRLLADAGAEVLLAIPPGENPLEALPPFTAAGSAVAAYLGAGKHALDHARRERLGEVNVFLHGESSLPVAWQEALRSSIPDRGRAVVSCTPYGREGPHSSWLGCELTLVQASGEGYLLPSGLAFEEFPERSPIGIGRYAGSYQAGTATALAALAALRASRAAQATEWVDVSIQDAQLALNYLVVSRLVEGTLESRANRSFTYGGVLRCADGYVELLTLEQEQWERLKAALGRPEWTDAPELDDALERGGQGHLINGHLREWASAKRVADVVAIATENGVPCGAYCAPGDLPQLPQLKARGFFEDGFPGPAWHLERAHAPEQASAT